MSRKVILGPILQKKKLKPTKVNNLPKVKQLENLENLSLRAMTLTATL